MHSFAMEALGLVMVLSGLYALWHEREVKRRAESARYWPRAGGKIVRSELFVIGSRSDCEARIGFEYEVDGRHFNGQAVAVADRQTGDARDARNRLDRYPAGAAVDVLYNPDNPVEAYLEARDTLSLAYPFVSGGVAVVGALLLAGSLPLG
jgi:hypothetical protein